MSFRLSTKIQVSIKTYSYSNNIFEGRISTEEAIALLYMMRYQDVPINGTKILCGDDQGIIIFDET